MGRIPGPRDVCLWMAGRRDTHAAGVGFVSSRSATVTVSPSAPTPPTLTVPADGGRRWLMTIGLLLLAGPLLFDLGYALHPSLPEDIAAAMAEVDPVRDRFVITKVMVAVGGLLMIALILTLRLRLVPERGRTLATIAAGLVAVGMASNSLGQATHGYLMYWANDPAIDPAAGTAIVEVAHGAPELVTLPVSFLSVPAFALGLLLFSVALWRAGTVPRWVPVAIVLGGVAAAAIGTGPAMLAVLAVDLTAFGAALVAASERPGFIADARATSGMAT